jgi:hypothetical protein
MDEQNKTICPLCGAEGYVEPELTEEVKDAFLESMLGSVPFSRVYDIMGGRITVTVVSVSNEVAALKSKLYINMFKLADIIPDIKSYIPALEMELDIDCQVSAVSVLDPGSDKRVTFTRELCSGLKQVLAMSWDAKTTDEGKKLIDDVIETFNNNLFPNNNIPKALLRGSVGKHNIMETNLIRECLDENFLGGTGR